MSVAINGFSRYLDFVDARALGLSGDAWLCIGLGVFFASVIALLAWWQKKISEKDKDSSSPTEPPKDIDKQIKADDAIVLNGFEFYPHRDTLRKVHPLLEHFKTADCIWALWNAGTQAYTDSAINNTNIQRILLPHPDKASIQLLANAVDVTKQDVISDIRRITRQSINKRKQQDQNQDLSLDKRIEIRWFEGLTGNTLTIGNPELTDDSSWIILETVVKHTNAAMRPSFLIKYKPYTELYKELIKSFKTIWDKSNRPTDEEIIKWKIFDGEDFLI